MLHMVLLSGGGWWRRHVIGQWESRHCHLFQSLCLCRQELRQTHPGLRGGLDGEGWCYDRRCSHLGCSLMLFHRFSQLLCQLPQWGGSGRGRSGGCVCDHSQCMITLDAIWDAPHVRGCTPHVVLFTVSWPHVGLPHHWSAD